MSSNSRTALAVQAAEYLEHGRLKESPGEYPNDITMISNLSANHEQVIRTLRKDADRCEDEYHDMGINDLFGLMESMEKWHGCKELV